MWTQCIASPGWWLALLIQVLAPILKVQATRNVTIGNTDPQVVYTPFLCNGKDSDCDGAWRLKDVGGVSVVTTNGPGREAGDLIPQMFIRFRASALFLTTSSLSTAMANLTLSAGTTVVSAQINTSIGFVGAINLIETETTMVAMTFLSGGRLDIGTLSITVSDDNATSTSFLPSATLPASASPPTFTLPPLTIGSTPSATPSAASGISHRTMIAQAVGLTVGLGLGLTALVVMAFICFRRLRRRWSVHFDANGNGYRGASFGKA